ncbi:unnamed protein product [Leptidea sinapis]|uniref:Uncharacterized protein n=1 Tax=Leptidea sinapis TaxID=189913 RepID=A0A5E4PWJ3_9NEOP|nr:unnamed protein product [Leptidea sinapis]
MELNYNSANSRIDFKEDKSRSLKITLQFPVCLRISLSAVMPSSANGHAIITLAPRTAKSFAISKPSPAVPPVTIAVRPLRFQESDFSCYLFREILFRGRHSLKSWCKIASRPDSSIRDARLREVPGNGGLKDTVITLHWVKENIHEHCSVW